MENSQGQNYDDGLEDEDGAVGGGEEFVHSRNIDDRTLKEWAEDRTSWTKSIR